MFWFAEQISAFLDRPIPSGFIVPLGLICLGLLAHALHSLRRAVHQLQTVRGALSNVKEQIQAARNERLNARLESEFLRDFVQQADFDRAGSFAVRHLVPNSEDGFAVIADARADGLIVSSTRGLDFESAEKLVLGTELVSRLEREKAVHLAGVELWQSEFMSRLSHAERRKVRELHLGLLGARAERAPVLLTTTLLPTSGTEQQRLDLFRTIVKRLTDERERMLHAQRQAADLQTASEMLELRSIADGQHETPLMMVRAFLSSLGVKLRADRVSLYLASNKPSEPVRVLVRPGEESHPGIEARWREYEEVLAPVGLAQKHPRSFDCTALQVLGIDALMGAALVAPLVQSEATLGTLCFSRSSSRLFTEAEFRLVSWAAEYFADTILRVANNAAIRREAEEDALTGLANRRAFDRHLHLEFQAAQQDGSECSLLMADLDRFKSINDRWGHQVGDEVLRVTAAVMREQVERMRPGDRSVVARYGGEELAVILPSIPLAGARRIAESIRANVESAIIPGTPDLQSTVSIGIATFPSNAESVDELIAAADAALYRAKEEGRNRVCWSDVSVRRDPMSGDRASTPFQQLSAG